MERQHIWIIYIETVADGREEVLGYVESEGKANDFLRENNKPGSRFRYWAERVEKI